MKRWEFKTGLLLLGWRPVETAIELRSSPLTITDLLCGDLDDELKGPVIDRAAHRFLRDKLPIGVT